MNSFWYIFPLSVLMTLPCHGTQYRWDPEKERQEAQLEFIKSEWKPKLTAAQMKAVNEIHDKVVKLALEYASHRYDRGKGLGWHGIIKPILPVFTEALETKPIKHAEKFYFYYAWLWTYSGNREKGQEWALKSLNTPYNWVEAQHILSNGRRAIRREFPLYWDGLRFDVEPLNRAIAADARRAEWDAQKVPKDARFFSSAWPSRGGCWRMMDRDKLWKIAELYEEMGDIEQAAHAYQNADIVWGVDTYSEIRMANYHRSWDKLANLYERHGNWDMSLNFRLKQLAGFVDERGAGGPERFEAPKKIELVKEKILYLLQRIESGEPVERTPKKYDLDKLRQISQLYLEMWFPDLAMRIVEKMEKIAGKELPEERARVLEAKAEAIVVNTSSRDYELLWVILWDEVWTHEKAVAVHKDAIEWGKKAKWHDDRIKKLEEQMSKLPDLLKYVREPKNFRDLLEGRATEPKW